MTFKADKQIAWMIDGCRPHPSEDPNNPEYVKSVVKILHREMGFDKIITSVGESSNELAEEYERIRSRLQKECDRK